MTLHIIQQTDALLQILLTIAALNRSFLERLRLFPFAFFTILNTVETEIFFLHASLVIFGSGFFPNVFLMTP